MNREPFPLEHPYALLADRALQGADAAEQAGLRCLLLHHPELDEDTLDRAAATLDLALSCGAYEPLPAALLERLRSEAARDAAPARRIIEPAAPPTPFRATGGLRSPALAWAGWAVAAAVLLYFFLPYTPTRRAVDQLAEQGALAVPGGKGPHGHDRLRGQFVWDDATQQGYMKLAGFDVNDPARRQYQLWIFDEKPFTRDTPIDGGVFDVKGTGEVIVPMRPNLRVSKPKLFAITVEPPGGVMVSKRDPLVFVGPVAAK